MATRSERDKQKSLQEKHQAILSSLLKEEDNKYCVDCDAKGPRWASWNLGVFLCIRCAGIHRNLGVHISKVKSVNLDSWTPEQIAMVQEMGNSRARAVYEANIPDHFRRPQTDSSLEAFIRSKYEQKKYIAKEWVPPQPKVQPPAVEEKKKKPSRPRPAGGIQLSGSSSPSTSRSKNSTEPKVANGVAATAKPPPSKKESAVQDLLGLDNPEPASSTNSSSTDPFGGFIGADTSTTNSEPAPANSTETTPAQPAGQESSSKDSLSDLSLFGDTSSGGDKKSTKESILALYGSSSGQQQMFGVPGGMYMPTGQQQQGQPMNMMTMPQQNGMMGNNMMGANMGMMGNMMGQNMPQNQMMAGQMGMPGMGNVMGGQAGMNQMPAQGMYNMPPMYQMPNQQQQLTQMQNQMAGMSLGQPMTGYQQAGTVSAGAGGWGAPPSGQTLSTNLWQ